VTEARAGARVLVISTDPAHSLGDALAIRLSFSPRRIPVHPPNRAARRTRPAPAGRGSLHAVELDARRAFARWLAQHRTALAEVLEHGTWLDRGDVDALLDLPLPGIDELAGMLEIARLANVETGLSSTGAIRPSEGNPRTAAPALPFDMLVVDTAPTGHTLRLLASPDAVAIVANALDHLQEEHRLIRARFAGRGQPEAADRLIALLAGQAQQIAAVLRDTSRAAFHWVALPEAMSLAETTDGIETLEQGGMHVSEIIVNRVLPEAGTCPVCDRRRGEEQRVVAAFARRFRQRCRLRLVPALVAEPRGARALSVIGGAITEGRRQRPLRFSPGEGHSSRRAPIVLSRPDRQAAVAAESLSALRDTSLLFFGGKGGVGKTTVAAAVAVRLARVNPDRRMLLLSTDPAHSLADVFNLPGGVIGDEPRTVPHGPSNLLVRELDAVTALAARRPILERALDDVASSFGAAAARHGGVELMGLAPPGIDELFGILSVVEAREAYQLIVVDMAPTGHALRLLQQPDAAREWVQAFLRMLLKYRSVVRPGQLAQELVTLSKSIRDLQTLLCDPRRAHVVVVTRAAELPRFETERLLVDLRRLRMATPAIVVNAMTLGPGRCFRCRETAAAEQRQLAALRRRGRLLSRRCVIIQAPLSVPPPRGINSLDEWARQWVSGAHELSDSARRPHVRLRR
jgi:arsenite/tail-anchored protein-transporting ATPase